MKILINALLLCALTIGLGACRTDGGATSRNAVAHDSSSDQIVAKTESGLVAGYREGDTYIYKGIPYAKAERFMPPVPADRWEGVRSSRAFGPTAPQEARAGWQNDESAYVFNWDDGYPGEDCQRLNIWTSGLADGKKRPVMVWLHGGGFRAGSGQEQPGYDGKHLSQKGVVVVTLNHRLNVLGFLDLSAFGEKYAQSGNVGMLDIVAALRWVHDNIENFGGDPGNVTIFGQSGGGGKVSHLMAMPQAQGLFHKAIVQSGSTLSTMTPEWSRRIGVYTLEALGIKSNQLEQLAEIPYEELLTAGNAAIDRVKEEYAATGADPGLLFGWSPTVDGTVLPRHPFMPDAPEISRDIPMIIGTTYTEFAASAYVPELRHLTDDKIMEVVRSTHGDRADEFVEAFAKAYPEHKKADLMDADMMFRSLALRQGRAKAQQPGSAPVWMYIFGWNSPVLDGAMRATHCMDIPFVFDNADVHASMTGGTDQAMALAHRMSEAWVNFARYGNPNGKEGISGVPAWPPYDTAQGATMWWDDDCRILYNHDTELLDVASNANIKYL